VESLASTDHRATERERIESWRLHVLIESGYPLPLAEKIAVRAGGAGFVDLHLAVRLLEQGCKPSVAAEILL
jgi:hypothetical protein